MNVWMREEVEAKPQSYLALSRTWQDGDTVKVRLPMSLHLHRARDDRDMAVIMYGPLTLAGELGTAGMPNDDVSVSQSAHSGMMDPPVPHLLIEDKDLSSCVKQVEGDVLRFKTVGIGSPRDVTLVPLHAMHHQRYTVYWNTKAGEAPKTLEPTRVSEADLVPGLDYKYYEGRWDNLPDFSTLEAEESGVVDNFDISKRKRGDDFGFAFSGYLKIAKDGDYYFAATSDDGSALSLAGTEIVNNDGIHAMISKSSGPLSLRAGFYPLQVTFFEEGGGEGLELKLYGGGGEWQRVPENMLFRRLGDKGGHASGASKPAIDE